MVHSGNYSMHQRQSSSFLKGPILPSEKGTGCDEFSCSIGVQRLEINCPSGFAILLGPNDYPVTPSDWFFNWYRFKYSKSHIPV